MPNVQPTVDNSYAPHTIIVSWLQINSTNPTCKAYEINPEFNDKTVVILGTWNLATVAMQSAPTETSTFLVVTDPQGNSISKTADAVESITENLPWWKPVPSSVGASTALDVYLVCTRRRP